MNFTNTSELQRFKNLVGIKFQLYNSLFTSLPFHRVESTGILIPLLLVNCEEGYEKHLSPVEILEAFFARHTAVEKDADKIDLLFRLVQYIERQVVLFDALEDASFREIHDMEGSGSMKNLAIQVETQKKEEALVTKLKNFSVQLVLTAHPTQFYRDAVLGIIHDLSSAVNGNNEHNIYTYLQQLGRTPFYQKKKPTPYDEAMTLVWYLENVFYNAMGRVVGGLKARYPNAISSNHSVLKMGFWPGGDRDGNPFVQAETTLKVARALRGAALKCYYLDVRKLKRRLTFKDVDVALLDLEKQLYENLFLSGDVCSLDKTGFLTTLSSIRDLLVNDHNGLFVNLVESLITRVEMFGLHFASLDIRQESTIHTQALIEIAAKTACLPKDYASLPDSEKIQALLAINTVADPALLSEERAADCLNSVTVIRTIQQENGEAGCNRYIISQCNSAINVIEVFGIFLLGGWKKENLTVDIVPLFETIEDLENAPAIMEILFTNEVYRQHLERRKKKQTIMLGFSDGTKDGGYMAANWGIYKAKEGLSSLGLKFGFDIVFFDGRGGPPARGGGKTHNFYASLGRNISNREIQLTVQGQTVSSSFGTPDAAQYNIEQLLHAGISNEVFPQQNEMTPAEADLIQELADEGLTAYKALKDNINFADYLLHVSPLRFYSDTNIGSRPAKRRAGSKLQLKDLRAIPFVGAWSQIKQNVTGYYGVGIAFEKLDKAGRWDEVQALYDRSLFFRTLMDNCEMAMKKCFFPLTAYLENDPQFGEIWNSIHDEYKRTSSFMSRLTGQKTLMGGHPVDQLSIEMRERIVLPLVTIQQYAIRKVNALEKSESAAELKLAFEKLAMRCSFGIINAGRNSA